MAELTLRVTSAIIVPLARDVAVPLVTNTWRSFAEPLVRRTLENTASLFDALKQAAHERRMRMEEEALASRMEQLRVTEMQLEELQRKIEVGVRQGVACRRVEGQ